MTDPMAMGAHASRGRLSLQHVIDAAPLAIAVFGRARHVLLQANHAAGEFFGRPVARLVGTSPAGWPGDAEAEFIGLLQSCLDLASESPPGVRRDFVRPSCEDGSARVWDTRFVSIAADVAPDADTGAGIAGGEASHLLMIANDVTELRAAEQERFDAAIAQRGMLVQEVHHRIKNNLQGVAGLLQQASSRFPQVAPILTEAVGQLQAIAQVYGLQVGSSGPVGLPGLLRAVAQAVQRTFSRDIETDLTDPALQSWRLPEAEAIPVALTTNELLTNAIKHGSAGVVRLVLREEEGGVAIEILNVGHLRSGFDIRAVPAGASGLGLVRALLPRRNAELALFQQDEQVCTRVRLRPPAVRRDG
jgi:two-component sensor histidine kinase